MTTRTQELVTGQQMQLEASTNGQGRLRELHERITRQVIESRAHEMEQFRAARRDSAKAAEGREQSEIKALKDIGIDVSKLEGLRNARTAEAEKRYRAVEAQMNKASEVEAETGLDLEIQPAFLPEGAHALSPVWVAATSSHEKADKLTAAAAIKSQALLTGGAVKDYWNWASGGGWGCLGSGVGENQAWIDFGFWFMPTANKFYSVNPLFRFRGYYIVQADDGFFDCKHSRVRVSAWTNVYQYNWKGWNHVDVLDVSGDNINTNHRFDDDRYTYNSYLLGAGDWAWIQCTIGLYVRAQGGGSYAKNDFATGNANYLSVPQCYVY